ncbi:MAG: phosphotransferase [Microbacterium sp.]
MSDSGSDPAVAVDEAALLAEAFDVPRDALRPISREPLGDGAVTGFEVTHSGHDGAARTSIAYVDTSGTRVPAETGLVLEGVARIWTHPADPHLPALVPAAFGGALDVLLGRLGIATSGAPEIVAYRPGRRAVLRIVAGDAHAWVKVVRPRRIERIVEAHRELEAARLPIPAVRGWSPDGILVLDEAQGEPAPEVAWEPSALLDRVDELRERLAEAEAGRSARTGVPQRLPWYADRAYQIMPEHTEQVSRIRAACQLELMNDPGEERTIHGDLHLGQLFLAGTGGDVRITGLIDVDTVGRGDPADDAAAFISHAAASAVLTEGMAGADRMWALATAAQERWGVPRVDALAAIHLLGHALAAGVEHDAERTGRLLRMAEAAAAGAPLRDARA